MLNHEGWSLLLILLVLILQLMLALPRMGRERSMADRLTDDGGRLDTAMGVSLRAAGVLLLAVIPGVIYRNGAVRISLVISAAAGLSVLLCVLVPRLKKLSMNALTISQAVAQDRWSRAGFAAVSVFSALIAASAAVSMLARIFAYVFSLHYLIALGVCAALCTLLALLCGPGSRRRMDRVQFMLLAALLLGLPAAAVLVRGAEISTMDLMQAAFAYNGTAGDMGRDIAADVLMGVGAMGLVLPAQRLFSARRKAFGKAGGLAVAAILSVMMLVSAFAGLLGRLVDAELTTVPAAEMVFVQMAEQPALPEPVSALLTAALVMTLLLYAQDALRLIGNWVSWDIVQPLTRQNREKPLMITADLAGIIAGALTFVFSRYASTPLAWFAQDSMLLGAVLAGTMLCRACGVKVRPQGMQIGLGAGTLAAIICMLLPIERSYVMLGIVPVLLATVLPQIILHEKQGKVSAEEAVETSMSDVAETVEKAAEVFVQDVIAAAEEEPPVHGAENAETVQEK